MKLARSSVPHARILEWTPPRPGRPGCGRSSPPGLPGALRDPAGLAGRARPVHGPGPLRRRSGGGGGGGGRARRRGGARLVAVRTSRSPPSPRRRRPWPPRAAPPRVRRRRQRHKAVALDFGDVPAALASAEHVFEDLFFYQGSTHLAWSSTPPWPTSTPTAASPSPPAPRCRTTSTRRRQGAGPPAGPPPHHRAAPGRRLRGKTDVFNHEIVAAKAALVTAAP